MKPIDQIRIIAQRLAAGLYDRATGEEQINILLATDWRTIPPARILLDLADRLLRAEARAAAAEGKRRT